MTIRELISVALPLLVVVLVAANLSLADNSDSQPPQLGNGGVLTVQAENRQPPSLWNWPKIPTYQSYRRFFNKVYSSTIEELRRAKLFMARALKVFMSRIKYMTKRSKSYLKINRMTDWTDEERRSLHSYQVNPARRQKKVRGSNRGENGLGPKEEPGDLPTATSDGEQSQRLIEEGLTESDDSDVYSFLLKSTKKSSKNSLATPKPDGRTEVYLDYRENNCFTAVKAQGSCGACYIFATLALFEYQYCMQHGKSVAFSEQYAIDCGGLLGLEGCNGGRTVHAYSFYSRYGLELQSSYPYEEGEGTCPYRRGTPNHRMGSIRVTEPDYTILKGTEDLSIQKLLEEKGPLAVGVDVHDEFDDYGGGVDEMTGCGSWNGGHAMLIVGHGIEEGNEYWLMRNSYGSDWGEDGHFKMSKSVDTDCIDDISYYKFNLEDNKFNDREIVKKTKSPSP